MGCDPHGADNGIPVDKEAVAKTHHALCSLLQHTFEPVPMAFGIPAVSDGPEVQAHRAYVDFVQEQVTRLWSRLVTITAHSRPDDDACVEGTAADAALEEQLLLEVGDMMDQAAVTLVVGFPRISALGQYASYCVARPRKCNDTTQSCVDPAAQESSGTASTTNCTMRCRCVVCALHAFLFLFGMEVASFEEKDEHSNAWMDGTAASPASQVVHPQLRMRGAGSTCNIVSLSTRLQPRELGALTAIKCAVITTYIQQVASSERRTRRRSMHDPLPLEMANEVYATCAASQDEPHNAASPSSPLYRIAPVLRQRVEAVQRSLPHITDIAASPTSSSSLYDALCGAGSEVQVSEWVGKEWKRFVSMYGGHRMCRLIIFSLIRVVNLLNRITNNNANSSSNGGGSSSVLNTVEWSIDPYYLCLCCTCPPTFLPHMLQLLRILGMRLQEHIDDERNPMRIKKKKKATTKTELPSSPTTSAPHRVVFVYHPANAGSNRNVRATATLHEKLLAVMMATVSTITKDLLEEPIAGSVAFLPIDEEAVGRPSSYECASTNETVPCAAFDDVAVGRRGSGTTKPNGAYASLSCGAAQRYPSRTADMPLFLRTLMRSVCGRYAAAPPSPSVEAFDLPHSPSFVHPHSTTTGHRNAHPLGNVPTPPCCVLM